MLLYITLHNPHTCTSRRQILSYVCLPLSPVLPSPGGHSQKVIFILDASRRMMCCVPSSSDSLGINTVWSGCRIVWAFVRTWCLAELQKNLGPPANSEIFENLVHGRCFSMCLAMCFEQKMKQQYWEDWLQDGFQLPSGWASFWLASPSWGVTIPCPLPSTAASALGLHSNATHGQVMLHSWKACGSSHPLCPMTSSTNSRAQLNAFGKGFLALWVWPCCFSAGHMNVQFYIKHWCL